MFFDINVVAGFFMGFSSEGNIECVLLKQHYLYLLILILCGIALFCFSFGFGINVRRQSKEFFF